MAVTLMQACVVRPIYVDLSYPPKKPVPYSDIDTVTKPPPGPDNCSLIVSIHDERAAQASVGSFYDGLLGEFRAPVLTEDNIRVWVLDAVTYELENLGYVAHIDRYATNGTPAQALAMNISLLHTNCFAFLCNAKIRLSAELQARGASQKTEVEGDVTGSIPSLTYARQSERAIGRALQEAIRSSLVQLGMVNAEQSMCEV